MDFCWLRWGGGGGEGDGEGEWILIGLLLYSCKFLEVSGKIMLLRELIGMEGGGVKMGVLDVVEVFWKGKIDL